MGNVLDPVGAAASLFDKRVTLRSLVIPRRARRDGAAASPEASLVTDPNGSPATDPNGSPNGSPDAGPDAGPSITPTEPPLLHPGAAARFEHLLAAARPVLDLALRHGTADQDLVQAARQPEFADPAARTAQQAAIAAAAILFDEPDGLEPEAFVDAWITTRGLPFATEAAVHLTGLCVSTLHRSNDTAGLRRITFQGAPHQNERFDIAARVRRHLATAADADHEAAFQAAFRLTDRTSRPGPSGRYDLNECQLAALCFLFPEHLDELGDIFTWLERRVGAYGRTAAVPFMLAALTTREQAAALARWLPADQLRLNAAATATAFATVGLDMALALTVWIDETWDAEDKVRLQRVLAELDSDEAMRAQLAMFEVRGAAAVLLEAAARFPERGLRLLAEELPKPPAARAAAERVLRIHVVAHRDLAREVAPSLSLEARGRVEKLLRAAEPMPTADPATLPELLVSPPWARERATAKPVVLKDLTAPAERDLVWTDDAEREYWLTDTLRRESEEPHWDKLLREIRNRPNWRLIGWAVVRGPDDVARTALDLGATGSPWDARPWVRVGVARFGLDALPAVLNAVTNSTAVADNAELVLPFACSEIAPLAADWNARLKSVRPVAQAWLRRHPGVAARALIPAALGKAGKARQAAEGALRLLAAEGFDAVIRDAAAGYGAAAASGIDALLAVDPLLATLPKNLPEIPRWAEPAALPQLLLAGRELALPPDATRAVAQMLTFSRPDALYPGLAAVKELCDAASLAAFAWGLFENWQGAGHPSKQAYGFDVLRWFGDDDTVRRLSVLIRAWPGQGGHARAVTGLDVLASIGGDTALIHLHGISQKVKFKGLKDAARARITAIADEMRLTGEQLADRLVPTLGLDEDGALELDYGPRRFTVFFDEQLKPGVVDEAGKRLRTLPKPNAEDDAELAPAAHQRFAGLKKDVRTLALDQIARLERAMVTRRRWTRSEFEQYLVGHPVLRHVVRRLVWADFHTGADPQTGAADDATPRTAFRVAEDLTYADVEDDAFTLSDDALIGVAHPLDLGPDLPRWLELFLDYVILQPFDQLGRSVFTLTPEEAAATTLQRFDGLKVLAGRILGMDRRGWRRSDPADAGWQAHLLRELPDGRTLVIDLEPGFSVGWVNPAELQQFKQVWIGQAQTGYSGYWNHRRQAGAPFSVLDPVTISEVLRDLTEVTAP